MNSFFSTLINGENQTVILVCLILAVLRIYLEVIGFNFNALPLTKRLGQATNNENTKNFHRMGLFLSIGYIILFAPGFFLA